MQQAAPSHVPKRQAVRTLAQRDEDTQTNHGNKPRLLKNMRYVSVILSIHRCIKALQMATIIFGLRRIAGVLVRWSEDAARMQMGRCENGRQTPSTTMNLGDQGTLARTVNQLQNLGICTIYWYNGRDMVAIYPTKIKSFHSLLCGLACCLVSVEKQDIVSIREQHINDRHRTQTHLLPLKAHTPQLPALIS